jgi:hypothetical protein
MLEINLQIDVNRTLEIVGELRKMGWKQSVDFDFACHKPVYDDFSGSNWGPVVQRHTVFTFYNDTNASYFMLRWG